MRRRRAGTPGFDMNGDPLPPTPPMWTDEDIERHTLRILAEREAQPARDHSEDPFVKMVKGAGKLWRKVNNNKKPGDAGAEKEKGEDVKSAVVVGERPVLAQLPESNNTPSREEGGVWEEEVGDRFPLNVSQTETIVEGQFSWSAAHLKPPLDETESVSDDASAREHNVSSTEGTEEDSTLGTEPESTPGSHS